MQQPPSKWVNIDDVVFTEHHCSGIEVIIRNEKGNVVAVMSKKLGVLEIEATGSGNRSPFCS